MCSVEGSCIDPPALTLRVRYDLRSHAGRWQNAGLVGVDPFYVSLRWEEYGEEEGWAYSSHRRDT